MYHDIYQNVCVNEFTAELLSDIVDFNIYFKILNEQKLNSVSNRKRDILFSYHQQFHKLHPIHADNSKQCRI